MSKAELKPIYCECCRKHPQRFWQLDPRYIEMTFAHGFIHPLDKWEMLNFTAYSCDLCGATDRERFIACFLRLNSGLLKGKDVVDFAPSASLTAFLKSWGPTSYATVDRFRDDVDSKDDISDLKSFASESTDLLICSHVLEHVPNDVKALQELKRILKPGGIGILIVPITLNFEEIQEDPTVVSEDERWKRFGQGDHVRIYTRDSFVSRIQLAGLKSYRYTLPPLIPQDLLRVEGFSPTSCLYIIYKSQWKGIGLRMRHAFHRPRLNSIP